MIADFLDAHCRHWADAETLFETDRLANADHLYGMAAECGLKRLMLAFGMETRSTDGAPRLLQDRVHADSAWDRYEHYRCGLPESLNYGLSEDNPFADWNASQRYAPEGEFSIAVVAPHRLGADRVKQIVKQADQDGLLI